MIWDQKGTNPIILFACTSYQKSLQIFSINCAYLRSEDIKIEAILVTIPVPPFTVLRTGRGVDTVKKKDNKLASSKLR